MILTEVLSPTMCPSPDIPDAVTVVATTETEDVYNVEPECKGSLDTKEELDIPQTFRMDILPSQFLQAPVQSIKLM